MPSDASGNYALPVGYLATTGTTVLASEHNAPLEDLAAGHSARLMRSGAAPMTGPLKLADGTSLAPSMTFASDTSKGFYKTASGFASSGFISAVPIGAIIDFGGSVAPSGWLMCFGQSLLIADYPALNNAIGGNFGAVDGSHFNLPDCRGAVSAGKTDMGGSDRGNLSSGFVLGQALGAESVTLAIIELPIHAHANTLSQNRHSHTYGSWVPGLTNRSYSIPGNGADGWSGGGFQSAVVTSTELADISINNVGAGGGAAHANVQPTIIFNKIIFAGV